MAKHSIFLVGVFLLAGCASSQNWYDEAGNGPTPESWTLPGMLTFVVSDEEGEPLGTFKLLLTREHVDTVEPDPWPFARLVEADLPGIIPNVWFGNPKVTSAYSISGDRIIVNLNASIYDDNIMLRGKLIENGAVGVIYHSSPFGGEVFGSFAAVINHEN